MLLEWVMLLSKKVGVSRVIGGDAPINSQGAKSVAAVLAAMVNGDGG